MDVHVFHIFHSLNNFVFIQSEPTYQAFTDVRIKNIPFIVVPFSIIINFNTIFHAQILVWFIWRPICISIFEKSAMIKPIKLPSYLTIVCSSYPERHILPTWLKHRRINEDNSIASLAYWLPFSSINFKIASSSVLEGILANCKPRERHWRTASYQLVCSFRKKINVF